VRKRARARLSRVASFKLASFCAAYYRVQETYMRRHLPWASQFSCYNYTLFGQHPTEHPFKFEAPHPLVLYFGCYSFKTVILFKIKLAQYYTANVLKG
jgi:hypothetical protein